LCALLLCASRSFAADPQIETARDEGVVVTATRLATPAANIGSAVTVITREDIERSQARTIGELLRNVPGLAVVQSGAPGGQTSVFLRGANSNQTLVLIDGARINNPLNGLATFANLTPDQIERVEIIRGPQSTLYGADALGGVINIITRSGGKTFTGTVALEGGQHDTFRQFVDISGSHKKFDFALSASHADTDNAIPNGDYENLTVGGKFGYRFSDRVRVSATFRYTNSEVGVPGAIPPGPNLTERLLDEIIFGRAALDLSVTDWWKQTLSVAETHEDLRDRNGAFGPSDSRTDVVQVVWQHTFPLADWNTVVAGLDWYQNSGQFSGFGSQFDSTIHNTAGFVQEQVTLGRRIVLTGGGRFDHHSQFGDEATYRFAGVLKLFKTHTRLKASAGTGFKAPTLNDLFFPGFSNPNLQPEESFGWDAGFEQDLFGRKATVGARYFHNDIDNLIAFDFVTFLPQNIQRARTSGVELFAEARPSDAVTLRGGYTYLDAQNLTTGMRLLRRPRHSGSVGANWRCCKRVALHTDATFVGSRLDVGNVNNAGYIKWDAGFTVDVTPRFQIFGRMENLLDDRYEEAKGFPALGRTWYLGAKLRF
jgi:vitamin B12 transporter